MTFLKLDGELPHMKKTKKQKQHHTAVRGKQFEVNDLNHLSNNLV
jgi:hypothetical protein